MNDTNISLDPYKNVKDFINHLKNVDVAIEDSYRVKLVGDGKFISFQNQHLYDLFEYINFLQNPTVAYDPTNNPNCLLHSGLGTTVKEIRIIDPTNNPNCLLHSGLGTTVKEIRIIK